MKLTDKQREAQGVIGGNATHVMLEGGSRSGKTLLDCRVIALRAIAAPGSRHAVLRFRFNHCKASIVHDTWPKMMQLCFPQVPYKIDKSDWFAELPGHSQVWFGGLDDKERTEKVLGQEYVTILLNECSQISWQARNLAMTRLAQRVTYKDAGHDRVMRRKMLYDCNPPSKAHWAYKLFHKHVDPDTNQPLLNAHDYAYVQMNPRDNLDNLDPEYIKSLEHLPARLRLRFLDGMYAEVAEGALWTLEMIDKWRSQGDLIPLPDMQRIVVAVDPSGCGDEDNQSNDEIGIIVAGLGMDGNGYVLEDLTCKAGPKVWGNVVVSAFDRWKADRVVAETNFGGDMVRYVLQSQRPGVPYKKLTASRGKAVRAEPIASLTEQGKVRMAGSFPALEDEMCSMTTAGYMGNNSPNRVDAMVWGMTELFPGIVRHDPLRPPDMSHKYRPTPGLHSSGRQF